MQSNRTPHLKINVKTFEVFDVWWSFAHLLLLLLRSHIKPIKRIFKSWIRCIWCEINQRLEMTFLSLSRLTIHRTYVLHCMGCISHSLKLTDTTHDTELTSFYDSLLFIIQCVALCFFPVVSMFTSTKCMLTAAAIIESPSFKSASKRTNTSMKWRRRKLTHRMFS